MIEKRLRLASDGVEAGTKFNRIRWLAVLLPTLSIGVFEFLRHQLLARMLPAWLGHGWLGNVLGALVVAGVVYVFVRLFTTIVRKYVLEVARVREEAAVVMERHRIAREMHDSVAQTLFYLTVKLREVDGMIEVGAGGEAREELKSVREDVQDTYRQVRAVISNLKEQAEQESFGEAVHRTVTELAGRLGLEVSCRVTGRAEVSEFARRHLVAIIQEALTNAHRHSQTRRIAVHVRVTGEEVEIEVSDDGVGFDPGSVQSEGHYGLAIMEERAQMAGGELQLRSAPGLGTSVVVRLTEEMS